jgi:hypothetical protein
MIIKNEILLMASICETITVVKVGKNTTYKKRLERLLNNTLIDIELKNELDWIWDKRIGVHIFELSQKEFQKYSIDDFLRAKNVTYRFIQELNKKCP